MAYSYTVTRSKASGDGEIFIKVVETATETDSEFEIEVPSSGRILRWKAHGSNSNVLQNFAPKIGEATGGVGVVIPILDRVMVFSPVAQTHDESSIVSPVYRTGTNKLYVQSAPANDLGSSDTITHYIYIRPTWGR